jgi:hypothetical protein
LVNRYSIYFPSFYRKGLPSIEPTDENLFHISYEAGILEDPNTTPPTDMWKLTTSPQSAPSTPEHLTIEFSRGLPVKVTVLDPSPEKNKIYTDAVEIFLALNALARKHGVGRIDIVENRFIGVKSRGCYESPGATILRVAHIDLEGLTLDRNVRSLRDQFVTTQLSHILYNGYFFSPEREFVTASIPASQRTVNGTVRLMLYKGNVVVEGRFSDEVCSPFSYSFILRLDPMRYLCTDTCASRVYTMSTSPQWTNSEASNQLTLQDLSKSSPSVSKSKFFAPINWSRLAWGKLTENARR